jgi:hypothetical protein
LPSSSGDDSLEKNKNRNIGEAVKDNSATFLLIKEDEQIG